ncbi:MAG: dicarboxylate/amino acid:cation symporter [Cyanobacteria bacterium SIG30]|nr:dicarboxylate/amino acid:cation symporter [Cyanobacteria bacterium SIG30]
MNFVTQFIIAISLGIKRNWHIFIGLLAGIVVGMYLPAQDFPVIHDVLDFIGQAFIGIIQMVVIPLVVSAIIIGIANIGDNKQLAKFGKKMIFYYAIITIIAVVIGATLALTLQPGRGAAEFINSETAVEMQTIVKETIDSQQAHLSNVFLSLIPKNPFKSLAGGEMVPIIAFVMIFAIALTKIGEINRPVVSFFESIFAATMKVTDWIMYLAAPGVFALTASAVSSFGLDMFSGVWKYILAICIGLALQLFFVYPIILKIFSKVPVRKLYLAITEAVMVAFGTASSSATLPLTIACCERRGISNKICSFVLPLGATLSMDGTALVQTVAVIFLTQAYGIELSLTLVAQIAFLAIVASSTCAGISGAGLITIALVLNSLGLTPEQLVAGFAFLFALERFADMLRTIVNVTSDVVVAAMIADNENELNYDLLNNPDSYKE